MKIKLFLVVVVAISTFTSCTQIKTLEADINKDNLIPSDVSDENFRTLNLVVE